MIHVSRFTSHFILPLADSNATPVNVGGKGAALARLVRAGLPVPDGFHITTAAYREFITANDLTTRLDAALTSTSSFDVAAQTIRALFTRASIPRALALAIEEAYRALNGAVAVRSSATAEDLPHLSFAGQQESFLNVRGTETVCDAVKRCWASLWNARALSYRAQHRIEHHTVAMAVLVQTMIPAEVAGVLFTAHPITGARDCIVINATWGLGDALVSGHITPDTFVVEKTSGRVIEREVVDKSVMNVCADEGIVTQDVPAHLQHAPTLNDAQLVELTRLAVQIEQLFGMPMDVEWTLARNQFAIVQARPITTL
ncbi:MAG: PEP/pyruvate-binding domain-containing protein [Anaerolineae bacterium]|nr:PEP/pyruvate-binding domain-containing protein [Anaerolineae bacterium]